MKKITYPKSFPNIDEERFLNMLLCEEDVFLDHWEEWNNNIVFNDIDYSITGLLPLLYLRLKKYNINNDITGRIKGVYKLSWFKNQMLIEEVRKLLDVLNKNHINTLLLKGIPMLLSVYKDRGARILGDGDILIEPKDADRAIKILIENGWNFKKEYKIFHENEMSYDYINKISHATSFIKDNIEIDIHWSVFHVDNKWKGWQLLLLKDFKPKIFNETHIKNSKPLTVGNQKTNSLCLEDMIIHLMVHGSRINSYRPLRWVMDSATIINNSSIDWDLFFKHVKEFNYEVEIFIGLSYLIEKKYIKLPENIYIQLKGLKLNKKNIKQYYRNSNGYKSIIGNKLPFIWYNYWKLESKNVSPLNIIGFMECMVKTWELESKKDIPAFVMKKYKNILVDFFDNKITSKR